MDAESGTRVVGVGSIGTQPAALEQRADHVAPVAQRVDERSVRKRLGHGGQDEGGLRRLLDRATAPDEPEAAYAVDDRADLPGRDVRDRRLERVHLPEIGEPGERADRAGEKGRARARAAEDEDEAVVEAPQRRPS